MRISDWSSDVCSSDLLQDAADAFLLALDRVEYLIASLERAGIDTEEGQRTHERVGHDLECQRRKRLLVASGARRFHFALVHALHRRPVARRRQEADHRIKQRLDRKSTRLNSSH